MKSCFLLIRFNQIAEMLPSILTQLGPDGLKHLKRLASDVVGNKLSVGAAGDDDVPELVENFEETANKDIESITKQTEEVSVA